MGAQAAAGAAAAFTGLGFAGQWHWYLDLFAQFRPQYIVVLAVALPLLILRRQWKLTLLATIAAAANLVAMFPHAEPLPAGARAENGGAAVRCISLNVLQGNKRFAKVERFLREENADVVVLQEVSPAWSKALQGMADIYPHQLLRLRKDSKGAAVLSRLPVRRLAFEELPGHRPIGAMVAEIEGAVPFTILGIHSHKPTSAAGAVSQRIYFDWLVEKCRAENAGTRPVVLMGDFNSTPWSTAFREFIARTHLLDTSRGVLFGATWSVHLPYRLLIDHAFVSPEWRVLARRVGPDVGSDHRAVIVDLAPASES